MMVKRMQLSVTMLLTLGRHSGSRGGLLLHVKLMLLIVMVVVLLHRRLLMRLRVLAVGAM